MKLCGQGWELHTAATADPDFLCLSIGEPGDEVDAILSREDARRLLEDLRSWVSKPHARPCTDPACDDSNMPDPII